jgi:hypothetical protein
VGSGNPNRSERLTGTLLSNSANPKNLRTYTRDVRDVFAESFTDWDDFKSRIAGKMLIIKRNNGGRERPVTSTPAVARMTASETI